MNTRILILLSLLGIQLSSYGQKYQMDVDVKRHQTVSYLVNDLQDVVCEKDSTAITLINNKVVKYANMDLNTVSWSVYQGTQSADQSTFSLDTEHSAIVTPDYSVEFLGGSITGNTNITVKKVDDAPSIISEGVDKMVVYDFTLDKPENFNGVAEIRIPMEAGPDDMVFGSYFNPETNKWEPVINTYNDSTREVVITTSHFSRFGVFYISQNNKRRAKLELLARNSLATYIAKPAKKMSEIAQNLREIIWSDDPLAEAADRFCDEYSTGSSIGLDIGYNGLKGLGLESLALDKMSDILGYVGAAVSIYQICRNDYNNQDERLAGNTMKFALNQCVAKMASAIGSMTMYACLSGVAIMDYALNQFAEKAHSGRRDMYVKTYNAWMDEHPRHNGDWATILKPYFSATSRLTRTELQEIIEEKVLEYCNAPWNDPWCAYYFNQATGATWTYGGGQSQALCDELAHNKLKELYLSDIPEAVKRLQAELRDEMFPKMVKRLEDYGKELNREYKIVLVDSAVINYGMSKSAYAGYTVRFKDHENVYMDGVQWETVLNDVGRGVISNTLGVLAYFNQKGILEVVSPKGNVIKVIYLHDMKAGYTDKESTNYVNIQPPVIAGVFCMGLLSCTSPTYNKGATISLPATRVTHTGFPGAIQATYDEDMLHVNCLAVNVDENDNVTVLPETMLRFDIENIEGIYDGDTKIQNLWSDLYSEFYSGDLLMRKDEGSYSVGSDIPGVLIEHEGDSGFDDDDDFDYTSGFAKGKSTTDSEDDLDDLSDMAEMIGAKCAVLYQATEADGLWISNFNMKREIMKYEWDSEAKIDVLIETTSHNFSLVNKPDNSIYVVVFFK